MTETRVAQELWLSTPNRQPPIDSLSQNPLSLVRAMAKAIQIDGKKFAALRQKSLKTQAEVAKLLGVTVGRVGGIESKERVGMYARNFRKLAEAFNMTSDDLLAEIGAKIEPKTTIPIEISIDLYDRASAYAAAHKIEPKDYITAAIEALMRLQGPPGESGESIAGRIDRRDDGPPGHRLAGKPKKPKGK